MRRAFRGHDMEAPLPAGFLPAVSGAPVQAGMMLENRTILRSPPLPKPAHPPVHPQHCVSPCQMFHFSQLLESFGCKAYSLITMLRMVKQTPIMVHLNCTA